MTYSAKKILYIQHASTPGGSCMSLLYTMQSLNRTCYQPVLALANNAESVINFYKTAGFEPIPCPGIITWSHSTVAPRPLYRVSSWIDLLKVTRFWKESQKRTLELVRLVQPDLVHLNSTPLSACAVALAHEHIPFVWHVREPPPAEFLGIRTDIIRHLLLKCASELIFISQADRQAWIGGMRGQVIPNFIDFDQFNRSADATRVRKELGIPIDAPVVLYVGGLRKVKGIFPLLKALTILKKHFPQLRCLMPGAEYKPPNYWQLNLARAILPLIGSGTVGQRVNRDIIRLGLNETCIQLPFQKNIAPLIAACDVLVFPAIRPHFARPVIEASAMAKPVIASRLAGIEELVQNNKTGLLVESNDSKSLAKALSDLLTDRERAKQMGETGYVYAKEKFSAERNCNKIMEIYDRILDKSTHRNVSHKLENSSVPVITVRRYCLEPLLEVCQEDIPSLLGPEPGVYVCECPEPEWYTHFGFMQTHSGGSMRRKRRMFSQMTKGSKWVSPTTDVPKNKCTQTWKNGHILHLAYRSLLGRLGQILQTISLFGWLLRYRREYSYCLVYNFYLPIYLAPLAVKFLLRKRLYMDYEDDYTTRRKNHFKNALERLMRQTVTGAICINEHMTRYFIGKPVRVFNAFADFKYTKSTDFSFRDGMVFLFGGTLDKIRGIELIPDLVSALRRRIKNFKILITGNGPLRPLVESWDYPEVKYLGFLDDVAYARTIKQADAYLVLQRPDHPFSLGSFPSKVDEYAEYNKPIFILKKKEN